MNCYNHHQESAVGQCVDCSKGLCLECASIYENPICENCNTNRIKNDKKIIYKELVQTFTIGLAAAIIMYYLNKFDGKDEPYMIPIMFWVMSGVVSAWKFINNHTPSFILAMNGVGWLIFLFIKFWISLFTGFVILPLRTGYNIFKIYRLNKL